MSKYLLGPHVVALRIKFSLFEEINSLLSEARLFGWLMNSTLQESISLQIKNQRRYEFP